MPKRLELIEGYASATPPSRLVRSGTLEFVRTYLDTTLREVLDEAYWGLYVTTTRPLKLPTPNKVRSAEASPAQIKRYQGSKKLQRLAGIYYPTLSPRDAVLRYYERGGSMQAYRQTDQQVNAQIARIRTRTTSQVAYLYIMPSAGTPAKRAARTRAKRGAPGSERRKQVNERANIAAKKRTKERRETRERLERERVNLETFSFLGVLGEGFEILTAGIEELGDELF